jgi:hypothetical protein
MRALMTNFQQVNIWEESEAFFESITEADIALRVVGRRVLIAILRCDAPAHRGAFADERRIVAASKAAAGGRDTPFRQ